MRNNLFAKPPGEVETWSYHDLVSWATWEVVEGILHGGRIADTMFGVLKIVIRWGKAQPDAMGVWSEQQESGGNDDDDGAPLRPRAARRLAATEDR